jgi:hypothetical protein
MKRLIFFCLVFISVDVFAYNGDGMGDHKAKKDIDMNGKSITNVDLVDGVDISAAGGGVLESTVTIPAQDFICNGLANGALLIPITEQETYRNITSTKTVRRDLCFTNGVDGRADFTYYVPRSGKLKMYTVNNGTGVVTGSWLQEVWLSTPTVNPADVVQYLVSESTITSNNQYNVNQPHDITLTGIPTKTPLILSIIVRGTATGTSKQNLYMKCAVITE